MKKLSIIGSMILTLITTHLSATPVQFWYDIFALKRISHNLALYCEQEVEYDNQFTNMVFYYFDAQLLLRQNEILQWGVGSRLVDRADLSEPLTPNRVISHNPYIFLQPKFEFPNSALTYHGRFGVRFGEAESPFGFWQTTFLYEIPQVATVTYFIQQDIIYNAHNTKQFDFFQSYFGLQAGVTKPIQFLAYYTIEFDKITATTPWQFIHAIAFGLNFIF